MTRHPGRRSRESRSAGNLHDNGMKKSGSPIWCIPLLLTVPLGCTELRARRHARDGNRLYVDGNYAAAVEEYRTAEALLPSLPAIALNLGLACRQLMIPGAKNAENDRSAQCALDAFDHLKQIRPRDGRGDQLYVQTLFDADRYDTLSAMYQAQLSSDPLNVGAINGLIQTYSRWDRWDDALTWMTRRAEIEPRDAEAQYGVGVFIWSHLFQKGGSGDKATFDPRPEAKQVPPLPGEGEIPDSERERLADIGIAHLEKALALRPQYREAMIYLNLLYRQKSYAFFDRPQDWQDCVDKAATWQRRAMETDASHGPQP
jgi:tetratricopeptide (TPR) repeat protein